MTSHGGCFSFLKFLVFTVNFILWLVGLGVLGVSLWLLFDSDLYLQTAADQKTDYYLGTYVLLGVGAIITIMGFLGCCGAWKESPWMLGTFFAFLLIVLFAEVAVGILVYFQGQPYGEFIQQGVKQTVELNYNKNNTAAMKTFDLVQTELECCGTSGPQSWKRSVFNEFNFDGELGIATIKASYNVPRSCCRAPETPDCSNNLQLQNDQNPSDQRLWKEGCVEALTKVISDHVIYILGAGAAVLFMEIFGMLCSLWLCCAVKRIEDMKA